ncbi:alpha/beta hydrolase family protein [Nakamurella sp.]|uniref:alpha/beta hydrolase family protein n=1 Tax=Nakamurella sp. TaxID=1869182 RepID=UPI00378456A4
MRSFTVARTPEAGVGFHCTTDDDVSLTGVHVSGPADAGAFVLAHGFTHGIAKPATRAAITAFAQHGAVVAADFRGHGRSGGRSSVGRDEVLDLDAVVRWTRAAGYPTVTVVGFSMGAAVAVRQAALGVDPPDAVVAVSAPSRWYVRESVPMRRLHWLLEHPLAVQMGVALGVRLGEPWPDLPPSPIEAAERITVPLLLVHGTEDDYFGPPHAIALQDASRSGDLWIEPGMGHGETALTPELAARIADWSATPTPAEVPA